MIKKKYRLEQRYSHRDGGGVENWKVVKEHDMLDILKSVCPVGYRIVDNRTGTVVWEPK